MDALKIKYGNLGSGYCYDPITIKFIEENLKKYEQEGIFRKTWSTWKVADQKPIRKSLMSFTIYFKNSVFLLFTMTYIKKLVMKGFKSFAKKTEIPFVPKINVIMGPNGSGKSNITDALCFVFGRLNAKSMRASKSSNLIFQGNKFVSGSGEALVESGI